MVNLKLLTATAAAQHGTELSYSDVRYFICVYKNSIEANTSQYYDDIFKFISHNLCCTTPNYNSLKP